MNSLDMCGRITVTEQQLNVGTTPFCQESGESERVFKHTIWLNKAFSCGKCGFCSVLVI